MKFISHLRQWRFRRHEDGQVLVLFVGIFILIFFAAVGSIDLGTYMRARQSLEVAVDAAVLAGGLELPGSGSAATSMAWQYININDPDVNADDMATSFRCLVGDRNHDGSPDPEDIPIVCDPGGSASFACENGLCISPCVFTGTNTCNVMAISATKEVPLIFTAAIGLPPLEISAGRSGSCKGLCGAPPTVPLDVIIILDRTISMSWSELSEAKDGAFAVLEMFNPELQRVGLAVLGAGDPNNLCEDKDAEGGGNWLVVPLSSDYQNEDGTLNASSQLVTTIECLDNSSIYDGTNLGSPLSDTEFGRSDALNELLNSDRDVKKGIILLTDGAANDPGWCWPPWSWDCWFTPDSSPCEYANDMANVVKGEDIELFTIGYGIEGEHCGDDWGDYRTARATGLLADMATDSLDDKGHCVNEATKDEENADGDHFFCQPKGEELESVFRAAAAALSTGIKLIPYPGE